MVSSYRTAVMLVCVLGLPLVASVPAQATGGEDIDECTEITESGTYELTDDIEDSDADKCIEILVGDVTLNGNDHFIEGEDDGDTVGVFVDHDGDEVVVTNLVVKDWEQGVLIEDGETTVEHVEAMSNDDGIKAESLVDGVRLLSVETSENDDDGIELTDVTEFLVRDATATDNDDDGLFLDNADDGDVHDSKFEHNGDDGIHGIDPDAVSITGNTVDDNEDDGIFITADGERIDSEIVDNHVEHNGDDGIDLVRLGEIVVRDNVACDNDDWDIITRNVFDAVLETNQVDCHSG